MAAAVVPGVLRTVSALTGIRGAGLPGLTTRAEPRGRGNRDTRGGGACGRWGYGGYYRKNDRPPEGGVALCRLEWFGLGKLSTQNRLEGVITM